MYSIKSTITINFIIFFKDNERGMVLNDQYMVGYNPIAINDKDLGYDLWLVHSLFLSM